MKYDYTHVFHLADPLVRKWVGKVPNSLLLEAPVGSRSEWKLNSTHVYRVNPDISLKAIPTLIRWTKVGKQTDAIREGGRMTNRRSLTNVLTDN
jgi:Eukaryotic protein of unknown function (DUF953)